MSHNESTNIELVKNFDELIKKVCSLETDTVAIISESHVASVYSEFLIKLEVALNETGKEVLFWKSSRGEKAKTMGEFEATIEFLLEKAIHRNSHIIAFGGGALSDMAGYVASSVLRGVTWNVIPTTLLSMIDASIGGKVAINSKSGKNLIGAFHSPQNVWINQEFLKTLEKSEMESGKAEMIKYFFLSKNIESSERSLSGLIQMCAEFKEGLVTQDLHEHGKRKFLNLGHTFGHAFEKIYEIPHGQAVFWGMVVKFIIFERNDLLESLKDYARRVDYPLLNPPWRHKSFDIDEILKLLLRDKKKTTKQTVDLILVDIPGWPVSKSFKFNELKKKLEDYEQEIRDFQFD